jgi:hypothetical protein
MARKIAAPTPVQAQGSKPKTIAAYVAVCLPALSPGTVHRDEDAPEEAHCRDGAHQNDGGHHGG